MSIPPSGYSGPSVNPPDAADPPLELLELPAEALLELPDDALSPAPRAEPPRKHRRLGEMLVDAGLLDELQLDMALRHQRAHGGRLGSVLVSLGFLSDVDLESKLSQQLGIMVREVDSINPCKDVLAMVPEAMMRKHEAIPIRMDGAALVVGMVDPSNQLAVDELIFMSGGRDIRLEMITEATLRRFLGTHFTSDAFRGDDLDGGFEIVFGEQPDDDSWEAVQLADFILGNAIRRRAIDIHVEPYETFFRVRLRVDGTLYNLLTPPHGAHSALITRIKSMADMDVSNQQTPQDGQIRREFEGETQEFRVSTLPTVHGEKCGIRLLKKESHLVDLAQLGFSRDQLALVQGVSQKPQGLVLVTGPTGSGTTTTLHAILNAINEPNINIVTLEDPVESAIPGMNHIAVKDRAGMGYADGLRSVLRQDPDVVFVGELRDPEVAEIAVKAALTGQLVLSTLHTTGAVETLGRLLDMGIDPYLLASATELVLAQHLLRRVCTACSLPAALSQDVIDEFDLTPEQVATAAIREPVGCKACLKTGYKGRVAVYESIAPNRPLRKLLREGASEQDILLHSQALGMVTQRTAGVARALAGETTFEEVRRRLGGMR